ncbi:MAG TPA: MoaD/ThiS family protein [Abditibacterium sp.]|jgi:molybdopterin synthase sulfur carrier subunit
MSVQIKIPAVLRPYAGNRSEISTEATTLRAALAEIESENQGFESRLLNSKGEINSFINIYVNDEDVRFLQKLGTPLQQNSEVIILPSASGGNGATR